MEGSVPTLPEKKDDEQILKTRLGRTNQPPHHPLSTWTSSSLGSGSFLLFFSDPILRLVLRFIPLLNGTFSIYPQNNSLFK